MLIIAPRNMHLDILRYYRKDNPFFDVKVIDKNDLIGACGYLSRSDTIIYMMTAFDYSYDEAETYLSFIKTDFKGNNSKLNKLKELQNNLINSGHLYKSDTNKLPIKNKTALVIGYYPNDSELISLSNLLDIKLEFFDYKEKNKVNKINKFSRLEDEVYYLLNEIAHDIDNGRDINDIYIFNRSEEYLYYLKTFSPLFGFQINYPNSYSLIKTGVYSEFKKIYQVNKSLDDSLIELEKVCLNDDIYHQFVDTINHIKVNDLPYEIESAYIDKKLASTFIEEKRYLNAVNLINEPTLLGNKKIYVIGFVQGQFPKSKKDDSYLNENELIYLNKLTNKLETKLDQQNILDFLKLDNEYVVSYSLKSLQNSLMFVSPLASNLSIDKDDYIVNPFENYFYSKDTLKYIACHLKDMFNLYHQDDERISSIVDLIKKDYCSYDNSYKGVNKFSESSHLRLSTSQLSDYANCPFKYYLGRILNVDPFEETIDSVFGNIVHELLEHSLLDDSYDISENYDRLISQSNVSEEIKVLWSLSLKEQIVAMVKYVKLQNRYMNNPHIELEKKIDIDLNQYTSLTGKIDKFILLANKYLVMIDYKTGSSGDFDETYLKEGLSSQLPTYALLAKESDYKDFAISGLYINHIYTKDNEIELKEDELIPKYLKLSGKSLDNYSSFFAFDSTIASGKSSFVSGISSKEEVLQSRNGIVDKEKLDQYIKTVKDKYLEVSELIRANNFEIRPIDIRAKQFRACQNCTYRDICYLRENQVKYIVNKEEENDETV